MHKRTDIKVSCNTAIFYYGANLSEGFFRVSSKNYNKMRNNRKKSKMYTCRSTSKESDGKNCGSNVKNICSENVTFSTNASEYCYYFLLSRTELNTVYSAVQLCYY